MSPANDAEQTVRSLAPNLKQGGPKLCNFLQSAEETTLSISGQPRPASALETQEVGRRLRRRLGIGLAARPGRLQ